MRQAPQFHTFIHLLFTYMPSLVPLISRHILYSPVRSLKLSKASFSNTARAMAQEYKIKGLSKLDLKSGEKREVEVEGIESGKVLLAKVGDKTHALSPNCTHYGAPMKLGVLTPDGRLTCAWHGGELGEDRFQRNRLTNASSACFNVASGDVEDAPALDPLAKFEIIEKSGGVYIKGDEKTIKASRRQPDTKCSPQGQEKVVVVGG